MQTNLKHEVACYSNWMLYLEFYPAVYFINSLLRYLLLLCNWKSPLACRAFMFTKTFVHRKYNTMKQSKHERSFFLWKNKMVNQNYQKMLSETWLKVFRFHSIFPTYMYTIFFKPFLKIMKALTVYNAPCSVQQSRNHFTALINIFLLNE